MHLHLDVNGLGWTIKGKTKLKTTYSFLFFSSFIFFYRKHIFLLFYEELIPVF